LTLFIIADARFFANFPPRTDPPNLPAQRS